MVVIFGPIAAANLHVLEPQKWLLSVQEMLHVCG